MTASIALLSEKADSTQIRPTGYGLMPFSLALIAFPILLFYIAWDKGHSNHVAVLTGFLLAVGALAMWVLTYHWRARIVVNPEVGTLEVRGRLASQTIHRRDIRSAVLYGLDHKAVAYLDQDDRRLLTLRLGYWSLADIKRVNDRLGILLNEWEKPNVAPPGKGILSFMERHRNWVGVGMTLLMFIGAGLAVVLSIMWIR